MRAYERFLKYVQYDTASNEASTTCPTTPGQLVLARDLVEEMKAMGLQDVRMDEYGYVYGNIPANVEGRPVIGLIAHMDTVDGVPVLPMRPRIVENYDGGPVTLENGSVLDPAVFPEVASAKGKDLIVTDGNTLLGADDKAGIAEILTACEQLLADPSIPHGKIMIGFTPDEEVGQGADHFDVPGFGADFAYTVDGGTMGVIEYENFNGASAILTVHGRSVHPGSAKNKMVNAARVATEYVSLMPAAETPERTAEYEGFYHLLGMSGNVEKATLTYIIRDHSRARFEERKEYAAAVGELLNKKYGAGTVKVTLADQYYNMREKVEPVMHIIDTALDAMKDCGIQPRVRAIRGGTDGAQLSFKGLPCPNIFAGGLNFHGPHEFLPIPSLEKASMVVVKICERVGRRKI